MADLSADHLAALATVLVFVLVTAIGSFQIFDTIAVTTRSGTPREPFFGITGGFVSMRMATPRD